MLFWHAFVSNEPFYFNSFSLFDISDFLKKIFLCCIASGANLSFTCVNRRVKKNEEILMLSTL